MRTYAASASVSRPASRSAFASRMSGAGAGVALVLGDDMTGSGPGGLTAQRRRERAKHTSRGSAASAAAGARRSLSLCAILHPQLDPHTAFNGAPGCQLRVLRYQARERRALATAGDHEHELL